MPYGGEEEFFNRFFGQMPDRDLKQQRLGSGFTVDKEGHDYLGQMCEDMGYEVVADIEQLPQRLPTLYRRLTE